MRLETELKLGFEDVLIRPKRSTLKSRAEVSLERTFTFKHQQREWTGVPIAAANMDTIATFEMAHAMADFQLFTAIHKHYTLDKWQDFLKSCPDALFEYFAVSTGISYQDYTLLQQILEAAPKINFICIDVANGYTEHFVAFVSKVRQAYPEKVIIAGNVVTGEMVEELLLSGADIIKVGIGPGSVCTTRLKTGVGYPQLSAIIECADAAHGLKGHVISDGGCTCPGDVAKAFGAGADFVMLGGMLAGHDEGGGTVSLKDGQHIVEFYGMSSAKAMELHSGGVADYRSAEGKTVQVPHRGPVKNTIQDILGGLRSACTYTGSRQLKELSKRTSFIMVREQENKRFT